MSQKKHTVGHLKINMSRKYILLLFFLEKCKKSVLCTRIKVQLVYQLVQPNTKIHVTEAEEIHSAKMF